MSKQSYSNIRMIGYAIPATLCVLSLLAIQTGLAKW